MGIYGSNLIIVAALALGVGSAQAAETVGEAVLIKTTVTGDGGTLVTKSPVHRDERIRTSSNGLGEFIFRDGTKFAIGGNSSVVIDNFVFNDSNSVKDLTINAAKGSFRWISGGSKSSAYKINTPAGTIGIRGTVLDIYVGASGTTAVVLLSGAANFCGSNGCQELKRRCDVVVATPKGGVGNPKRAERSLLKELGNRRALPFLSGDQRLSRKFRVFGSGCQLSASLERDSSRTPRSGPSPSPSVSPSPEPSPSPSPEPSPSRGNNGFGNGGGDGTPNSFGDGNR